MFYQIKEKMTQKNLRDFIRDLHIIFSNTPDTSKIYNFTGEDYLLSLTDKNLEQLAQHFEVKVMPLNYVQFRKKESKQYK